MQHQKKAPVGLPIQTGATTESGYQHKGPLFCCVKYALGILPNFLAFVKPLEQI